MKFRVFMLLLSLILIFAITGCGEDMVTPTPNNKVNSSAVSENSLGLKSNEVIGNERAKEIALNHAGVNADKIYDLEIELDRDYGEISYEVSFDSDGYEYDYDIDAYSGDIIKSDKKTDY